MVVRWAPVTSNRRTDTMTDCLTPAEIEGLLADRAYGAEEKTR